MAFFNDLVRAIASVEGMEEMTVRGIGLNVRDEGHISKGGRGLSAARMTVRDAANLLIGVNGCVTAREAGSAVTYIRELRLSDRMGFREEAGKLFKAPDLMQTFGEYLESLIDMLRNEGSLEKGLLTESRDMPHGLVAIQISFEKPDYGVDVKLSFESKSDDHVLLWFMGKCPGQRNDRKDVTSISAKSLKAVAQTLDS